MNVSIGFDPPAVDSRRSTSCYLTGPPPTTTTWTTCAAEAGTCTFTGTHEVAFGANGQYSYGSYTGGTPCTNTVFGDPISGTSKSCYVQ
ncbi:hypothetical protein OG496_37295 [Streptomyces sp. NBC_00988]|uniref:hypothetical protein n=1 Tax=Streptomyces sp. NBC_00988 TaxID=2903704 RepID=UPI0038695975|nr:hypothetical protein OG496_37295 [Streptomyces sp. NBC_00988]